MNQLGMKFVPVNDLLMVSAWETRVKDYQVYIESVSESMPKPSINNKPDEPIVYVSYKDAVEFAEWLTKRDIKEGLIPEDAIYRIPTDHEWSIMVGLDEDEKKGIASKALGNEDVYPWTGGWEAREGDTLQPLVEGADPVGNFSDESRKKFNEELRKSYYKGYRDGHSGTSPVGIFKSNNLGVFDLAGNVSEWMQETYYDGRYQVYRGSNFQYLPSEVIFL